MKKAIPPAEHAKLSPSGAVKWINCPGSLAMEYGIEDLGNAYSWEGTAAHAVAAHCQEKRINLVDLIGEVFPYKDHGEDKEITVTEEMAEFLQTYLDTVKAIAGRGRIYVEQRLEFSPFVGIPDQFGTSDVVVPMYVKRELQVHDLKYGRGVKVEAEENEQLKIYGLGALLKFAPKLDEFDNVRLVIHQPRLDHVSEWVITVEALLAWAKVMGVAARKAMMLLDLGANESDLVAGEDQCRFCKAKGSCKAMARAAWETMGGDFEDLETPPDIVHVGDGTLSDEQVGKLNKQVDMVKMWCVAINQQLYMRLMDQKEIPGYKLVMGKQGNREWHDEEEAAQALRAADVHESEMYKSFLISPTEAERLLARSNPRAWAALAPEIKRSPASLTIAHEKDKRTREGRKAALDDFDDMGDLDAKPKVKRAKVLKRDRAKNTAVDDFKDMDADDLI